MDTKSQLGKYRIIEKIGEGAFATVGACFLNESCAATGLRYDQILHILWNIKTHPTLLVHKSTKKYTKGLDNDIKILYTVCIAFSF